MKSMIRPKLGSSRTTGIRETRSLQAYDYFRDEIKREDAITGQRLTYSLSLQGLLIASVTLLLSNGVSKDVPTRELLVQLRQITLLAIIILGFFFSLLALLGIEASLRSVDRVIDQRAKAIKEGTIIKFPYLPTAHGEGGAFKVGRRFPLWIISMFGLFWGVFGVFYGIIILGHRHVSFLPLEVTTPECVRKVVTMSDLPKAKSSTASTRITTEVVTPCK